MRKAYADSRHGQIHLRYLVPAGELAGAPVACLHPAPYSGLFFNTIAPYLADGRAVVAPDYPGYGGSDPGSERPSITGYAEAMCDALHGVAENPGTGKPFDLFGFHTGCLVAIEMSLLDPALVRRLVLVDVPYFEAGNPAELQAMIPPAPVFSADVTCLENAWKRGVGSRWGVLPLARSLEIFTEELRAGERVNLIFHAARTYESKAAFAAVEKPVLVIATSSPLRESSRAAAKLIHACSLQECPEVSAPAMETGARIIATQTLGFLDG